ncbi:MAG: GNAT family N-acetyltransferase [Rubrivivax sp.]|nr:GNAT family N-acetyltransferase [Pyrinomonadaceae bacterium]
MAEEIMVRFAAPEDLDFLSRDSRVPAEDLRGKIERREVIMAERGTAAVGFLRLEYLWSFIPYVALIRVSPEFRRGGVGKAMLRFTEDYLRTRGHVALYSSSQADEPEPQAWHRHVGFEECGYIAGINGGGVGEVFFRKLLG